MSGEQDFMDALTEWKADRDKPRKTIPCTPPPPVTLTDHQKRFVIDYVMCPSKGIFECPEFWNGLPEEATDLYPSYRQAVDDFVEELKKKLLDEVT